MPHIPNEIWVHLFGFLNEAEKRKMSVACSLFNDIYKTFCSRLPKRVEIARFTLKQKIISLHSWYNLEYLEPNKKVFDIFGPNPSITIILNETKTFQLFFKHKFPPTDVSCYPDLKTFVRFNMKIIETHDCWLKFTKKHSNVYFVKGCKKREIHSI